MVSPPRPQVHNGYPPQRSKQKIHCCLPTCLIDCCIWPYLLVRRVKDKFVERRRQRDAWPKPILAAPSIAHDIGPTTSPPQVTTSQKPKFFSLPLELRLQIYDIVFGLTDIHLLTFRYGEKYAVEENRFKPLHYEYHIDSFPCTNEFRMENGWVRHDPRLKSEYMCTCLTGTLCRWEKNHYTNAPYRASGLGVLELMLVNRAFYHDVLNTMVNHRTWQFDNLPTILLAPVEIPLRHFTRIRSLHINAKYIASNTNFMGSLTTFPAAYRRRFARSAIPMSSPLLGKTGSLIPFWNRRIRIWNAACSVIANMEFLKRLRIELCYEAFAPVLGLRRSGVDISNEAFVFGPLLEIGERRDLEVFDVEVDWPTGEGWGSKEKDVFRLKRRLDRAPAVVSRY